MLTYILLQSAEPGFGAQNLILIGGFILIIYFFMFRPQQKKQKDQKKFLEAMRKGDQVVTIGGLHGKVYAIEKEYIIIEVDKGTKLKFDRSSISFENSKAYDKDSK